MPNTLAYRALINREKSFCKIDQMLKWHRIGGLDLGASLRQTNANFE